MTEFPRGQWVNITLRRALIEGETPATPEDAQVIVFGHDAIGDVVHMALTDDIIIELCPPDEWPPQRGDRWRDRHGLEWDAMYRHDEAPFIELEPTDGSRAPLPDRNEWVRRERGPLTLVHRKQQDGGVDRG